MVTHQEVFLVDTTFLFENAHKVFFGAPLFIKNGQDNTFTFGFMRDLLRIRQAFGISNGILIVGEETYSVTSKDKITKALPLLTEMGFPIIHMPNQSVLDLISTLSSQVSHIITQDETVLQFAKDKLPVILFKNSIDFEVMYPNSIISKIGVGPKYISTYMALTKGSHNATTLTKLQAIRVIELFGDLEQIYGHLSDIKLIILRKKLISGKDDFLSNYSRIRIKETQLSFSFSLSGLKWRLNSNKIASLLKSYGFYSLVRLLKLRTKVHLAPETYKKETTSYTPVIDSNGLEELETLMSSAKLCSVDTESDDKNPHQATLFGVAFSRKKGESFFVSLIENDLRDITPEDVISSLKRLFSKSTQFIGHNIKYDCLLLRRNGLKIKSIHFDTMLAAYDCYGDWDLFNLKYLSERLLGKIIKSYKDVVKKDQTFLELPFKEIVKHACEDADVTLRLYQVLIKEMERKGITKQYFCRTMIKLRKLVDLEYGGISVNSNKLKKIRKSILDEVLNMKQTAWDEIGKPFDIDSQKELRIVLNEALDLREFIGYKRVTLPALEQLAINRPIVQLIVKYKRKRKQLMAIDSIIKNIREGKIYPSFNQTKSSYGQLAAKNPNLFDAEPMSNIKSCFNKTIRSYFKNAQRSLDVLEKLSEDVNLINDRVGRNRRNKFMEAHPLMKNVDQDDLLLSLVIGYSDAKLSRRFMVDYLKLSTIRLDLTERYAMLFSWLDGFRKHTAKQGYAKSSDALKYLSGLRSSNIAKRGKAMESAVRWLVQY